MINQSIFSTLKIIIFLTIVISSTVYCLKQFKNENEKKIENFPPWTSECPDNWVKVNSMNMVFAEIQ